MSFVLIYLQLVLGILTLLNIKTGIPLFYGVLHQLVGILFYISLLFFVFFFEKIDIDELRFPYKY